jgi:hypothetical protein
MSKRDQLLQSIAKRIADYRAGEIDAPTPDHVDRWINQFDKAAQLAMLGEFDHIFEQTYFPKPRVEKFLSHLMMNEKIAGANPCDFWKDVRFLDIQGGGNSQKEMLEMFGVVLRKACRLDLEDCGEDSGTFLYLDDAIFSGNRIRHDLSSWIETDAPNEADVHVVVIALHAGGQYYASGALNNAARDAGKKIGVTWWRCIEIEDRKTYTNTSDVLRPASLPEDELTGEYVETLKDAGYPPVLRQAGRMGSDTIFSSEEARDLLEQQLLKAGLQIKQMCPNLKETHRPLGYSVLKTLGFGSLLVTFRNCANNCPLAFWAGDPWYPLFPRRTN